MSAEDNDFQQFKDVYESGLKTIAETKAAPPPTGREHSQVVQEAIATGLQNLKRTSRGTQLYREGELWNQFQQFEHRLQRLANVMQPATADELIPPVAWAQDAICRLEREYQYYGEMGRILHYFRDRSEYLTRSRLEHLRLTIIEGSRDIGGAIDKLLGHAVSEVLFSKDDLQRLRRLADETASIGALTLRPGRDLDGLLPEDDTVVRRQFMALTCQLALRLFGHVTRSPVEAFLSLKSTQEVRKGYSRWRQGYSALSDEALAKRESSDIRMLNRAIKSAYNSGLKRAEKEKWQTCEFIRYTKDGDNRARLYADED